MHFQGPMEDRRLIKVAKTSVLLLGIIGLKSRKSFQLPNRVLCRFVGPLNSQRNTRTLQYTRASDSAYYLKALITV